MAFTWDYENAAHLLRRAGFGGAPEDIQEFFDDHDQGPGNDQASIASAAAEMANFRGKKSKPPAKKDTESASLRKMQRWWLKRMIKSKRPADAAREKLVLFLHDHLVSGASKQDQYRWLSYQNRLFRSIGGGDYRQLIRDFNRDPANLYYLDGILNKRGNVNENWAREVLELFCHGVFQLDVDGMPDPNAPNYTEDDVISLARASSGWGEPFFNDKGQFRGSFDFDDYDPPASGPVELYIGDPVAYSGASSNLRWDESVAGTNDDVLKWIFLKEDGDGNNQVGMFLASKLWTWYAFRPPSVDFAAIGSSHPNLRSLFASFAQTFVTSGFRMSALLEAIWSSEEFYCDEAKSRSVKNPADYTVQALRAFRVKSSAKEIGDSSRELGESLERMGMELFEPPNVAGWPGGLDWINAGTLLERYEFARRFGDADAGSSRIRLSKVDNLKNFIGNAAVPVPTLVDQLINEAGLDLGPTALSTTQRDELVNFAGGPGATVDLSTEFSDDAYDIVRALISIMYQTAESQIY